MCAFHGKRVHRFRLKFVFVLYTCMKRLKATLNCHALSGNKTVVAQEPALVRFWSSFLTWLQSQANKR